MSKYNYNILVTGGAGFIGSNIVEHLLEKGTNFIRILDNLSTGKKNNINKLLKKYDNLEFMYGDITDLQTCKKAMKDINLVCHQAALGSVLRSINDPISSHNANVNGFLNILTAAKENNVKRVVFASSSSVYGDSETLPKVENNVGKVLSPYAATKMIDEIYGNLFTRIYGMECIGLRYFNVFGPRQDPNGPYAAVIPRFINSINNNKAPIINGDGTYSRDFTYIQNAVSANVLALTTTNEKCFGEVFNVGANGQITISSLFNKIKEYAGSDLEPLYRDLRKGDIPHSNANISKAIELLNYKVLVDFDEGIIKTIDYYSNLKTSTQADTNIKYK